ncbi:carboxypeptidase-like regulatory domain-containing protein [Algoriphagus limi]|uniref:Carboxypeptidase-like regulatory domain-containing protein n=1 Tax=Algoriphagus limi TaxID=2975273 RepID=A0ABT2G2A9_9BACT|nr:carboxypeptidase-like regulatory domain-containing protein [Algoriphagus limi]MCS5489394.1 carboxypeptidase-like regulatory domain-containing protein [Algoriphagus limi]
MSKCLFIFIFVILTIPSFGQAIYSGNVLDSQDKGFLEGVIVSSIQNQTQVETNIRGYFSIQSFPGDTLLISFPGFISQKVVLGADRFLMIELQDEARFLPEFEVQGNAYSYRLKDGRLVLKDENELIPPSRKGEVIAGTLSNDDGTGGVAVSGVISYFTKKARLAREYEKKKEWHARRAGYYQVIESDSIRAELMQKHALSLQQWDELVIRFNQFHLAHEFLDWPEAKVQKSLEEFIEIETQFLN